MQPEVIQKLIESQLPQAQAIVEGDGSHFSAIVIYDGFAGKSRIQKQQLVYDTVKSHLLDGTLHALTIKTFTQSEWQALQK